MSERDLLDLYLDRIQVALNVGPRRAREICEEVRGHLDDQIRDLQRKGLNYHDAVTKAIEKFGEPKIVALVLTEANSQHRREQLLKGLVVGVLLGSPIWYIVTVMMWVLHMISAWGLTKYWYESVILGGGLGGIVGLGVASSRLRVRRVCAVLALVTAVLYLVWSAALLRMGAFADARTALRSYLNGVMPLFVMVAAIGFVVEWGVHRWVLGNASRQVWLRGRLDGQSVCRGRTTPTRARGGYTLLELLVVIVILGLLAGILLPAVANTRGTAKQASCINNLRQIGLAFQMYLDDYEVRPTHITDIASGGYISPGVLVCPKDPTGDYGRVFCRESRCGKGGPSLPTSYVYISRTRADNLYERLERLDGQGSYLVCPSHGRALRDTWLSGTVGFYEGKILRLSFDGSVHIANVTFRRAVLWHMWQAFTDVPGEPPFDDRPF